MRARLRDDAHPASFAQRLSKERPFEGLDFVQVALDDKERPTFGFVPGVAKTSLARHTAARLGVTRDELQGLIATKKRAAAAASAERPRATRRRELRRRARVVSAPRRAKRPAERPPRARVKGRRSRSRVMMTLAH